MKDVIAVDLDDTVVDITDRLIASLKDAGVDPGSDPSATLDGLKGKKKTEVFKIFQSEKYTDLDKPNLGVIARIQELHDKSGLPIVIVTGRLDTMMSSVKSAVDRLGLPIEDIIVRPEAERMRRTPEFKVSELKKRGYAAKHVFDDDGANLAAMSKEWPDAELHHVVGGTVETRSRLEALCEELRGVVLDRSDHWW